MGFGFLLSLISIPFFAAETSLPAQTKETSLPDYIFLLENLKPDRDLVRKLEAYQFVNGGKTALDGQVLWNVTLDPDRVFLSDATDEYIERITFDTSQNLITKIRFKSVSDEASKYHDVQVNEVFQIVAIGEEVEDGQMCPPCIRRPCPPCVLKTNYAVTCLWNIQSGVEYSCSTSPSYSKVSEAELPYLVRGIQKLVRYDVMDPFTSDVILCITQQVDFNLLATTRPFNASENVLRYGTGRDVQIFLAKKGDTQHDSRATLTHQFSHAWKVWDSPLSSKFSHAESSYGHSDSKFDHFRDSDGAQFALSRFHWRDCREYVPSIPSQTDVAEYKNTLSEIPFPPSAWQSSGSVLRLPGAATRRPAIGDGNAEPKVPGKTASELLPPPGRRDLLPDDSERLSDLEELDRLSRWHLIVTFLFVGMGLWQGRKRHGKLLYYFNVYIIYDLSKDFFVYVKNFNQVRRRTLSETGPDHTSVEIDGKSPDDAGKMIPELYRERHSSYSEVSYNIRNYRRYEREFRTVSVLGRGGFGTVFEAQNLNDGVNYAVKRIELPSDPDKRDKAVREAKANLQISQMDVDTTHMIQYYHYWVEEVSLEWMKKHDGPFEMQLKSVQSNAGFDTSDISESSRTTESGITEPDSGNVPVPSGGTLFKEADDVGLHWEGDSDGSWGDEDQSEPGTPTNASPDVSGVSYPGMHRSISSIKIHGARLRKNVSIDLRRNPSIQSGESSSISFARTSSDESADDSDFAENDDFPANEPSQEKHSQAEVCEVPPAVAPERSVLYLQLQLCSEATLKNVLAARKCISSAANLDWFGQICRGVSVLHGIRMIHRDLKPANILFSKDKGIVKLGDLGLITIKEGGNDAENGTFRSDAGNATLDTSVHTGGVGTRLYMAPELREGENYSYPVDIFALGIILLELFCLFGTQSERVFTIERVKQPKAKSLPNELCTQYEDIANLILKMTQPNPKDRPTIEEIIHILAQFNEALTV